MDKKLLRYLKMEEPSLAAEEARSLWREAQALQEVAAWQACLGVQDFFQRFDPHAANSRAVGRLLARCGQVCLLVVTLGDRLEQRARDYLHRQEAFRGYILDRLGSYLVEQQMRLLDRQVSQEAKAQGLIDTRRYSPGYGDFALEANSVFVELAAGFLPGLELAQGGLLRPEKTITAIKGLSQHPPAGY